MTEVRAAPYPPDTRAKGWRFELDYERIDQSDTWGLAAAMALDGLPLARPLLLAMWYGAWKQTPCGSLPADDRLLAAAVGIPVSVLCDYREILLRGWWLADDGRLYHDVVTQRVLEMLDRRGIDRSRQEARQKLFEVIRARDGRACVYCAHTKYLTLDHLLPLSRGGDNNELNLAIACRPCNSKKRDRTPDECGFEFISEASRARWASYKELRASTDFSGGETARNAGGAARNDTGTGTGTNEKSPPKPPRKRRGGDADPEGFSDFWKAYPRKVGIDAARKAFAKREPDAAMVAAMVKAIRDQGLDERVRCGEAQYVPHPSTWLNEGRWQDETAASVEQQHWFDSPKGVIAKGIELGLGAWSEADWAAGRTTDYLNYRARVFNAAGHSPRAAA